MTEQKEADQDISSINHNQHEPIQISDDVVDEESGKAISATVDEKTVQEYNRIPNIAPDGTDKENSDNCMAVNETAKLDEVNNLANESRTKILGETTTLEPQTLAVTDDAKQTESLTSQPRTHKESFVSEDGEESTTTEESNQSTGQVFVIQFANTVENTVENTSVKVINTSRVETPEDDKTTTAETTVVEPEKVPTAQESTPQEASVTSEQNITSAEISQESETQTTSKTDSTDSKIPEDTKSDTNSASSNVAPKRLSRTVSFTIETTSKITREASIIVRSEDVVVSSSSSPSPSEQPSDQQSDQQSEQQNDQQIDQQNQQQSIENSDDVDDSQVIVNPDTEEVSFRPRRRATSNTMHKEMIIRNPAVPEETTLDNFNDDEDFPQPRRPRPRISTLSRFRGSFSFGPKGRTLSRSSASFVDKSKNNFLSFHNVGYTVQQKKYCRRVQPKVILKNVR